MGIDDPDRDDSSQHSRAELFSDLYFGTGWSRHLPATAIAILGPLMADGWLTRDELQDQLRRTDNSWATPAWEPVHEWTDEELVRLDAEFEGTSFAAGPDEPSTAAEVTAEEAEARRQQVTEMDGHCAALGVPPVRTLGDLLAFMVACQVLVVEPPTGRIGMNPSAPLPDEILQLDSTERSKADTERWRRLHEGTAQSVIDLFDPSGARLETITADLQTLADRLGVDPESARAGVVSLLADGDFTASTDVDRVEAEQPFTLTVDWETFFRTRMTIRIADPPEFDEPT